MFTYVLINNSLTHYCNDYLSFKRGVPQGFLLGSTLLTCLKRHLQIFFRYGSVEFARGFVRNIITKKKCSLLLSAAFQLIWVGIYLLPTRLIAENKLPVTGIFVDVCSAILNRPSPVVYKVLANIYVSEWYKMFICIYLPETL